MLAVVAIVTALTLAEIGLRVLHHSQGHYSTTDAAQRAREQSIWRVSPDPELVYVHRSSVTGRSGARLDAHGVLRVGETILAKPDGMCRVVVLGDSIAAGLSVPSGLRFADLLDSSLRVSPPQAYRTAEVLNFAVDGYDTRQEARLLETHAGRFDPDLVIVQYCLNDPAESVTPLAWFRDPEPPVSELLALIGLGGRERLVSPAAPPSVEPGHWASIYDPDGAGWPIVAAGLDRIGAFTRASEIPGLVVIVPLLDPDDPSHAQTAPYRAQVAAHCEAAGLSVLDLSEAFAISTIAELRHADGDIYHLSAEGHAAAARAVETATRHLLSER